MRSWAIGYVRARTEAELPPVVAGLREWAGRKRVKLAGVFVDTGVYLAKRTRHVESLCGITDLLDRVAGDDPPDFVLVADPEHLTASSWTVDVPGELKMLGTQVVVMNTPVAVRVRAANVVNVERVCRPSSPCPTRAASMLEGRRRSVREGFKGSGPVPYGYMRGVPEAGRATIVPDAAEAEVVRWIFTTYLRPGASIARLVVALNERRLRTRQGKVWSRAGVAWILKNPLYVGRVRFDGSETRGRHRGLVSSIAFNRANVKLREQRKVAGKAPEILLR